MKLKIIHTNDIHANFKNVVRLASAINEYRDDNTLLLDAGDMMDRSNVGVRGSSGDICLKVFEYLKYDVLAIGNNEAFLNFLSDVLNTTKIPYVCCNLKDHEKDLNVLGSVIKEVNGIRVLIIGNCVSDDYSYNRFLNIIKRETLELEKCIRNELNKYHNEYDVSILLSHAGLDKDKELAATFDFDVIIGGHTHSVVSEMVNGTYISQAGIFGEKLGVVELDIDNNGVNKISGSIIDGNTFEVDSELDCIIKETVVNVRRKLSEVIGIISNVLDYAVCEEDGITNLLADALFDLHDDVDMAIVNGGVLNGGLYNTDVSMLDLIGIAPSPLRPVRFKTSGKQIKAIIEKSLDRNICMMLGRANGFRGKYAGNIQVSNNCKVIIDNNEIKIYLNNVLIDDNKLYTLISSDYLMRGVGYDELKCEDYIYDNIELLDVLKQYLFKDGYAEKALNKRIINTNN